MYFDNTRAIVIAKESGITKGARHHRAKVHYLREVIEFGDVKIEKVHTVDNLAYLFTKALPYPKHSILTKNIRMIPARSLMKRISEKRTKNKAKTDKTEHGMEKHGKDKVKSKPKTKKSIVKVKPILKNT
ncbi:hypothetical protein Tco_0033106 [Tanacetum coccineum]